MAYYWLLLGILGVWRLTHMLHGEDGPGDFFATMRRRAGATMIGKALDCFLCLSVWVALPFSLWIGGTPRERLLLWPALSAGAIFLERWRGRKQEPPIPFYFEEKEEEDVLRR